MLRASQNRTNLLAKDQHFTKKSKAKPWNTGMQTGPRFLANDIRLSFSANWKSNSSTSSSYRARVQSFRQPGQPPLPQLPSSSSSVGTKASEHIHFLTACDPQKLQRPLELVQEKIKLFQAIESFNVLCVFFQTLHPSCCDLVGGFISKHQNPIQLLPV